MDSLLTRPAVAWCVVFGLCLWVYLSTGHYFVSNIDGIAASWPGWELVHHGTLRLEHEAALPPVPWFLNAGGHVVSNRMAGIVLIGVPAQVLLLPLTTTPLIGGVVTAALTTSAAMANLCVILRRALPDLRLGLAITAAVALGTGYWVNAAAELWPHGPLALWLTLAMLALQREREWLAGAALAPAIWTRPHIAVAVLAIGLVLALAQRTIWPLMRIGVPTTLGLGALVLWNTWMFGEPSIGGEGYSYALGDATSHSSAAVLDLLRSAAGSLVSPLRGMLVHSPFVLLGAVAVVYGMRRAPAWAVACAVGGASYQIVQWNLNGFGGGTGYFSYRLTLELVLLSTPAASLGYVAWRAERPLVSFFARLTTGLSIGFHVLGAFWFKLDTSVGQFADPWRTWGLWRAATARGDTGTVLAVAMVAVICAVCLAVGRGWRRTDLEAAPDVSAAVPSAHPARPTPGPPAV